MSDKTKIEWSDSTWNPVTGCTKVSEGCRNCYAKTFAERFEGTPGHYFESGFKVTLRPERLGQPLRWKRPRKIFVNSMSDLFHPDVPDEYIDRVFAVMALCPQHTFQVLTKRPERMREYLSDRKEVVNETIAFNMMDVPTRHIGKRWGGWTPAQTGEYGRVEIPGYFDDVSIDWPLPNVWLGVSVENQQAADERIPLLLQTPAAVRFLSCEPLLGPVNLGKWLLTQGWSPSYYDPDNIHGYPESEPTNEHINWVIVGGESGRNARPMHPNWARSLRNQCNAAGVPFFFKQWGEWKKVHDLSANDPGIKGKLWHTFDPDTSVCRIGKEAAGRMLDGRVWSEMPLVGGGESEQP
ncbi:protein gp37 [Paenibacillus sp. UNCCL117]|uniref:DUF5131 family protein n=1 Tax=unclassified Paenibacillus TaxID=185978 RepID=UPI0008838A81|nr:MULTISPECIES: phage Gp37/Gp68 family protein [unclassified Paenibacillus]SDD27954.1 protein gp37 [Paenibacillus sp. cl123]SFW40994.1 protein gp37 [Paenibacillus sp. UNCCL117]